MTHYLYIFCSGKKVFLSHRFTDAQYKMTIFYLCIICSVRFFTQILKGVRYIWHGNESTHLCGLLFLLNTLSFPMKNLFSVPQPRMYLGTRWIFFFLKVDVKKLIKVRITDHTSWLDAASPLSSCHVFHSCRAQRTLYLFVGLFVVVALSPKTPAPHRPIYHCHHPGSSI